MPRSCRTPNVKHAIVSTVGAFLSYTNVKEQGKVQLGNRINNVDSIYLTESAGAKS